MYILHLELKSEQELNTCVRDFARSRTRNGADDRNLALRVILHYTGTLSCLLSSAISRLYKQINLTVRVSDDAQVLHNCMDLVRLTVNERR